MKTEIAIFKVIKLNERFDYINYCKDISQSIEYVDDKNGNVLFLQL